MTLDEKLRLSGNRPAGFDYLRLVLAVGVILQHTINVSYGRDAAQAFFDTPARGFAGLILPMFFALSGFLVAGSLIRSMTLISFAGLRIIRIIPALAVEVLLSALILGPVFTSLAHADYFSAREFYAYFLNILGEIHFTLPGVFLDNPLPATVNGQLWTVPYELKCYLVLGLLALFGLFSGRRVLLATLALGQLGIIAWVFWAQPGWTPIVPGMILIGSFLAGILLFQYRSLVPWHGGLFLAAFALSAGLLLVPRGDYLASLPIAYMTVYLGLSNPPRAKLLLSGDYSYGLFLYGFPIQQAVASLTGETQNWLLNFVLTMPFAAAIAVFSWWMVEKPALKAKPALVRFETFVTRRLPAALARLITPNGVSVLWSPPSRPVEARPTIADYPGYVPNLRTQQTKFRQITDRLRSILP